LATWPHSYSILFPLFFQRL